MGGKVKRVLIKNIILDLNNPRHTPKKTQKEIIEYLAQHTTGFVKLAESIIAHGLNPTDLPILYKKSKNKFVVLEGNRRIATLILLNDPNKISDENINESFRSLHENSKLRIPKFIDCVVYDDLENKDSKYWIKLKHTGSNDGVGVVRWDPIQQARFAKKTAPPLLFFNYAEKHGISVTNVDESNLKRLISTPIVRKKIGINIKDGKIVPILSNAIVKNNIKKIFEKLSEKSFKVKQIYTLEDRKAWIRNVIPKNYTSDTESDKSKPDNSSTPPKSRPMSTTRSYFIPRDCEFHIKNNKINNIFYELKHNLYLGDVAKKSVPNAVSVLFRVFLEISLDEYMTQHKLKCGNKKNRYAKNCTIKQKINLVCDHMLKQDYAKPQQLKYIGITANGAKTDFFHIDRLHEYVHNRRIAGEPNSLKTHWDNIQEFFEILWNNTK